MRSILFFLTLIFITQGTSSLAQGMRSNDFAVTLNRDTIYGFIQMLTDKKINIAFTQDDQMMVKKLKVSDLNCLVINDTVYRGLVIIQSGGGKEELLAKLIIEGPVSLFERDVAKTRMWKPTEEYEFSGVFGKVEEKEYFLKRNESAVRVDDSNFSDVGLTVFRGKKRIIQRVKEGIYTFANLNQAVLDYNYLVEHNLE